MITGPKPKIEVSEMDGGNRKSIVTEGVFWPNGLALDYAVDRIYWTDAKRHAIESAKLDGTDRRKVIQIPCERHIKNSVLSVILGVSRF